MSDNEKFLTIEEVAALLKVHVNTCRSWVKAGALKAIRLPGRRGQYRIARSELEAFLDGSQKGPAGDTH